MQRFESEEIYNEYHIITRRINDLKAKYLGDLDNLETIVFADTIRAFENLQKALVKIDNKRQAKSKKLFMAALRRNVKEVKKWPKWKREIFGNVLPHEGDE